MVSITKLSALAPLAAAAALLGPAGCNNDPGSGTLTINYQFGIGGSTCANEGVETIRVSFGDETETEPCNDDGQLVLSGVPARNYNDFVVEGIDAESITVRDNLAAPAGDESIEVIGGSSQDVDVTLTPTPASIELTFVLLDEDELQLPSLDSSVVESFDIRAAEGTNAALLDSSVAVDDLTSAKVIVPDENRSLDGERVDTVVINYTANGNDGQVDGDPMMAGAQPFSFEPPGDGRLIQIRITCIVDACEGVLMGTDMGGTVTTGGDSDTDSGTDSATSG